MGTCGISAPQHHILYHDPTRLSRVFSKVLKNDGKPLPVRREGASVCQKSRFSRRLLRCISDRPRSQARWPSAYPHPPAPRPQGRGEKMAALRAAAAFSAALRRRYQKAPNDKNEVFRQAEGAQHRLRSLSSYRKVGCTRRQDRRRRLHAPRSRASTVPSARKSAILYCVASKDAMPWMYLVSSTRSRTSNVPS